MPVATGDAFRYITTQGTNVGESDATLIAPDVNGTLTVVGGFGITLTADAANRKITITNTGNGTGALTTVTDQNASGTFYPIFTSAPSGGDINPATGTYQMSTMYLDQTTTPMTYTPSSGMLNIVGLTLSGTLTVGGVTSTGATGTDNVVFSTNPTLTTPVLGVATATTINKITLTTVATGATITATDGTTITLPSSTGTVALNSQQFYIGSTQVAINRASGAITLNSTSIDGNAGTVTNGFYTSSSFNLGTTSVAVNRASASQSLTGINIDGSAGKATNIIGGNNTTLLGALPYQSNTDTTTLLSPNTSATKNFLTQTGNGTNGAAPSWGTLAAADIPAFNLGTTSITFNRASASQSLTGISIDGNAGTVTNGVYTSSSFNLGTTSITWNRASASQSLTGINIDGSAGSVAAANITGATLASGVTASSLTSFGTTPGMTSPAITTSLTTPSTTFSLVNTTATTVSFAGGATTSLTMGNSSGSTTLNGNIVLGSSSSNTIRANVGTGTPVTPGTITGYMIINVNGTNRYVPYYT
jgi:hypothetical protein